MRVLEVYRVEDAGRRVRVLGLRVHHGLLGASLAALGLVLVWHDRRDWPWRLLD